MVDSITASTSVIGLNLLRQKPRYKDVSVRQQLVPFRLHRADFIGHKLSVRPFSWSLVSTKKCNQLVDSTIKSLEIELTKEKMPLKDWKRIPKDNDYMSYTRPSPSRLWPPNNADNPMIHNPLLRQERMGCGWFAVIFEWEGVIIKDDPELEKQAWFVLAQQEGKSPPPTFILSRTEGMKNEQAISEVLCWSRDPLEVRRLASRKEEIHQNLRNGGLYEIRSGSQEFMSYLMSQKIPIAIASTRPRKYLEDAIESVGLQGFFDVIVAAEDVHRGKPDPEMFVHAAQLLSFIQERCIVFGNSNSTVEAAHDAHMKCVAVASKHPVYELSAADHVVRRLDELTIVDLKSLVDVVSSELEIEEPEVQLEEEEETSPSTSAGVDDIFW